MRAFRPRDRAEKDNGPMKDKIPIHLDEWFLRLETLAGIDRKYRSPEDSPECFIFSLALVRGEDHLWLYRATVQLENKEAFHVFGNTPTEALMNCAHSLRNKALSKIAEIRERIDASDRECCGDCEGSGYQKDAENPCETCEGSGTRSLAL